MAFVPIHNHSDYSLLDGASQLPLMVQRAKELGMPALALTDHGVMYGAIELLKLCKAANIKPIIGNEMYVINGSIDDTQPKKEKRYHLVVVAKNQIGYENLVKLTTLSHLNGVRGRGIFSRFSEDSDRKECFVMVREQGISKPSDFCIRCHSCSGKKRRIFSDAAGRAKIRSTLRLAFLASFSTLPNFRCPDSLV